MEDEYSPSLIPIVNKCAYITDNMPNPFIASKYPNLLFIVLLLEMFFNVLIFQFSEETSLSLTV